MFEIDRPGTQEWKRARLAELGLPAPYRFVPVDFESGEQWPERLAANGFEMTKPAVVASTGVSMYLTREANAATLRALAGFAPGTVVAMTFQLPEEYLDEPDRMARAAAMKGAKAAGTPFVSFFAPDEMLDLARECGFQDVQHVSGAELNKRYLPDRSDGLATAGRSSWWRRSAEPVLDRKPFGGKESVELGGQVVLLRASLHRGRRGNLPLAVHGVPPRPDRPGQFDAVAGAVGRGDGEVAVGVDPASLAFPAVEVETVEEPGETAAGDVVGDVLQPGVEPGRLDADGEEQPPVQVVVGGVPFAEPHRDLVAAEHDFEIVQAGHLGFGRQPAVRAVRVHFAHRSLLRARFAAGN